MAVFFFALENDYCRCEKLSAPLHFSLTPSCPFLFLSPIQGFAPLVLIPLNVFRPFLDRYLWPVQLKLFKQLSGLFLGLDGSLAWWRKKKHPTFGWVVPNPPTLFFLVTRNVCKG